jgi:hypothetical protein
MPNLIEISVLCGQYYAKFNDWHNKKTTALAETVVF